MFDVNVTDDLKTLDDSVYEQFINLHSQLFGKKYTSEVEAELKEKGSFE